MATYPEDPAPTYPFVIDPEWSTTITPFTSGKEERRQRRLFPAFNVTVQYGALTQSNAQTVYDFYMARKGAYEAFYIYDLAILELDSWSHDALYIGTGDGTTTTFDIPGRSTSAHAIYVSGAETDSADYTILTGGGSSNSDRITFDTAPTSGSIITCDFTGALRIRARFAEDKLSRELFLYKLYRYGVQLKGLQAA